MMSSAPTVCLFILACILSSGHGGIIGPYSPLLKTSATKTVCSDCAKMVELVSAMISQPETQDLLQETAVQVCRHLPSDGRLIKDCLDFMRDYLTTVLQRFIPFTSDKTVEICTVLGLCATQGERLAPELLGVGLQEVQAFSPRGTVQELQITPQCTFCLFLIKKLEDMLPKERTEESVVKLLEQICNHMPDHYKQQCNELLEKYGKEVLDFLLTTATPHTICMFLHLCLVQDAPALVPSLRSDCKTCKILMILTQIHLRQNTTVSQMTSLLWRTCHLHPNALPGCKPFIQGHSTVLVNILSKQEEAVNACQTFFCAGHE